MIVWWKIMVLKYIWWHFVKEQLRQQLIELDAFTVVIKHDTVETNINMFNNVIWPLTQNILKITGIMSLKFGTPYCLHGTPFLGTHGVPGLQNASPQIEPCLTHWGRDKMDAIFQIWDAIFKCIFLNQNA